MPATTDLRPASLRALRDIATGHLAVWRTAEGEDRPDRVVAAGAIDDLTEAGLIVAPECPGAWTLTEAGRAIAGDHGWL